MIRLFSTFSNSLGLLQYMDCYLIMVREFSCLSDL